MSFSVNNSSETGHLSNAHNHTTISVSEHSNLISNSEYSIKFHQSGYSAVAPIGRSNGPESNSTAHESSHIGYCSYGSVLKSNLCTD